MVCFLRESFEPKRKVKLWQTGSPVILFLIVAILMDVTHATCGSDGKASVYNVRDLGSIPGLGRFPGEGNGNGNPALALKIPWT